MIRRLAATVLASFVLTEVTELSAARWMGLRNRRGFLLVFLVNLLTNPAVVLISFLLPMYTPMWLSYGRLLALLELAAFIGEALMYRTRWEEVREMMPAGAFPGTGPFLLSGILNGVSFGAGFIISHIIG